MELKIGNVLDKLKEMPNESVDCIMTSPPYYGLRSYKGAETIWGSDPNCRHEWNVLVSGKKYYICPYCRTAYGTRKHSVDELGIHGN